MRPTWHVPLTFSLDTEMFRYSVPHDGSSKLINVDADIFQPSQCDTNPTIPIRIGEVSLLRQRAFKLEKLVPVVPTRFVLVAIPWCLSSDIDQVVRFAQGQAVVTPGYDARRNVFAEVLNVVTWVHDQLANPSSAAAAPRPGHDLSTIFEVIEVLCDTVHGETMVVIDVGTSSRMIDVLDACDTATTCAASLGTSSRSSEQPSCPSALFAEAHKRRLVAFPFDPRPLPHILEQEEYYPIPACMLCCDRLDRTISGIVANICSCPDDSCSCIFSSRCPACRAACLEKEQPCTECGVADDTWACLMCGYLGCSRYRAMHVTEHCQKHGHGFSLSLTTQQIWDYQSDRFVHRLVLNVDRAAGVSERMQFPEQLSELENSATAVANAKLSKGTKGGQPALSAGKVLVDAKLDAKLEQCCANYSRELAAHLAKQRDQYMAAVRNAPGYESSRSSAAAGTRAPPKASSEASDTDVIFGAIAHELRDASDAAQSAARTWAALQVTERDLAQLEQDSSIAEGRQAQIKDQFRKLLTEDAERKSTEDSQVRELEETIADLKLNLSTKQRMVQKLGKGDQLGSTMAVLGGTQRGTGSNKKR